MARRSSPKGGGLPNGLRPLAAQVEVLVKATRAVAHTVAPLLRFGSFIGSRDVLKVERSAAG